MKRAAAAALAAAAVVALSGGCAHLRLRDGPGDVDLASPPPALAARGATLPRPALDRALVISTGLMAGFGGRQAEAGLRGEAGLGLELGVYLTRLRLDDVVIGGDAPGYSRKDDPNAWGINLGWTPTAMRWPEQQSHQPSAYVEAQWRQDFPGVASPMWGLAAGVAFTPEDSRSSRTAVQLTPLLGPIYTRVQFLLDGNVAIELGVALKIPVVVSWGS